MEIVQLILHNVFSFIVIISFIVFIHEFGHYWVAKRCGVKIEAFSIGFGPKLWGWRDKSGTEWRICSIPMGGYVQMFGDEGAASTPDAEKLQHLKPEDEKVAFHTQPLRNKFMIVAAGPIANFLLAIVIFSFFFNYYGKPEASSVVGAVVEGSSAAEIDLQPGDHIIELNNETVRTFSQIKSIVSIYPNTPLPIVYQRNGERFETTITPQLQESTDIFGNTIEMGLIGVGSGEVIHHELSILDSVSTAFAETYNMSKRTLEVIGQMITGSRSADQISGILRIADYSGKSVDKGMQTVFWFMAILSINLGLINLFPIPMLDGGHLLFYIIEAIAGRPLPVKAQEMFFRGGFVLLIMLMIFATFNDLKYFGIF